MAEFNVMNESQRRKFATVVVADVVGYSRLMESNDSDTVARLQSMQKEVVSPQTHRFRGRIVKTTGDGWLAEFSSATDAVRSSIEIQDMIVKDNAVFSRDQRIEIRIGVNLGDIFLENDDIFGTGVNVAKRLETLAAPGGICISKAVYDQIQGILDLAFEDMGDQTVKNISYPIHCYLIRLDSRRRLLEASEPDQSVPRASVAVLPFANLSNDPDQEYFADGMAEDIITALSRFRQLFVIARNSTFVYKHQKVDIRQVARELGVRYVLEGSVRRVTNRLRFTAQLIDASTGGHLWADRFDGGIEDIFELQDRITEKVVGAIEPHIRRAEITRARRKRPENLEAYDRFLQALPLAYAMKQEENVKALSLCLEALHIDPSFAPAAAFAAWCYEQRVMRHWPTMHEDDARQAVGLARSAIVSATDDENTIALAGFVLLRLGRDYDSGMASMRRALKLNPNNAFVLMLAGWGNLFGGDLEEGMTNLERARDLSPADPTAFYVLTGLGMGYVLKGQYAEAAALATVSAALYGDWDATYVVLSISNAYLGRIDDARMAADKLQMLLPKTTVSDYKSILCFRDPERLAIVQEGLRIAGVKDKSGNDD